MYRKLSDILNENQRPPTSIPQFLQMLRISLEDAMKNGGYYVDISNGVIQVDSSTPASFKYSQTTGQDEPPIFRDEKVAEIVLSLMSQDDDMEESTIQTEASGEFVEPLYTLQDELGLEDNILVDELAKWMSGQDIAEFVDDFRRDHDMVQEADIDEADIEENAFNQAAAAAARAGKDTFEFGGKTHKTTMKKDTAHKLDDDIQMEDEELESVDESPTMDTTQLVTLLKNSGLSEEAIAEKLDEWANTPEGVGELEPTAHGDAYDFAQGVNLSLKKYLDAEDMKVGLKEHTVESLTEAYKKHKE